VQSSKVPQSKVNKKNLIQLQICQRLTQLIEREPDIASNVTLLQKRMSIEIPTRKDKAVQNHVLRSQKNAGRAED